MICSDRYNFLLALTSSLALVWDSSRRILEDSAAVEITNSLTAISHETMTTETITKDMSITIAVDITST